MEIPLLRRRKIRVKVVKKFVLKGTIDGHKPLGTRFMIKPVGGKKFYVTYISVNWGRGYAPGEFKRNVLDVLDRVDGVEYVVLGIQELDEDDSAKEHAIFRSIMEPGTTLVEYETREPLAVSPGVDRVWRERKVMTMDQGSDIGAPNGTGPRRFFVSCLVEIEGVVIGFGNQHPHRIPTQASSAGQRVVVKARVRGEQVTRREVGKLVDLADLVIHGGDMNNDNYPKSHPKEKVANKRGPDTIRFIIA